MSAEEQEDRLLGPPELQDLFENNRTRAYTLNIDKKTYDIITAVAEQTGKSRPKVLSAFVEVAYNRWYRTMAKGHSLDTTDEGNHKPTKKKRAKKGK